jgi:hypothetical protein
MKKVFFLYGLVHVALILTACIRSVAGQARSPETPSSQATPTAVTIEPTVTPPARTPTPMPQPFPKTTDSRTPQNALSENQGTPVHCPGVPVSLLKLNDWARVSVDPPLSNRLRSQPDSSAALIGQVGPGENVLIEQGPLCADGYRWWKVRSLDGDQGWTADGDINATWLVEPISPWTQLPAALDRQGTRLYDLREIRIAPDMALVQGIDSAYYPLATPLPTPVHPETESWPDDPRGDTSAGFTAAHAEHSSYTLRGLIEGEIQVFDRQDPVNRFYLNQQTQSDCVGAVERMLKRKDIEKGALQPFCGSMGAIPFEVADVRPISFSGGKGVRFLVHSGNNIVYGRPYYFFQGVSDDGRYYIYSVLSGGISHAYMVEYNQLEHQSFGPLMAWGGQESKAYESYRVFNTRLIELMDAGEIIFYPDLTLIDEMFSLIEIK